MSDRRKSPVVPIAVAVLAALALTATLAGSFLDSPGQDEDTGVASATASSQPGDAGQTSDAGQAQDDSWKQLVRYDASDPLAMGDVDAPVVMLAYSDFQCPYCAKFARDTMPALIGRYVEAGTLRIEWRDFPYLGEESTIAAHAARAAGSQDSFWAFHDELFAQQMSPNSGDLDEDYVAGIAQGLGLDVEQFRTDLASEATRQAVESDFAQGQAIGVTGTPAFIINGVPVMGAQPVEIFEQAIEEAAAEAGS